MTHSNRSIPLLVALFTVHSAVANDDVFDLSLAQLAFEPVTVASAFAEQLLESSSSVTVTKRSEWRQRASRNSAEVLAHMPSTMVYPSLATGAIAIRGYAAGFSSVRGVATLLDGVPLNTLQFGAAQYDKFDLGLETLDRIELIRGPSSAIYGSDAFHGVFASSTYRAKGDEVELSLDADSEHYLQAGLRAGKLIADGHQLSVAFSGSDRDDLNRSYRYTDPVSGNPQSSQYGYSYDSQSLSLRLSRDVSDSSWFYDVGFYANQHEGENFSGVGQLFGGSIQRDREHTDIESEFMLLRANVGHRFSNGIKAELRSYYWQSELDHWVDFSRALPAEYDPVNPPAATGEQLTRDNETRRGAIVEFSQANARFNTDWLLQLSYDKSEIDDNITRMLGPDGGVVFNRVTGSDGADRITRSVVFQAKTWLFDNSLALLYGGRLDDYSDTPDQSTPRLGLIYRLNPASSIKWLYGQAFRAPTSAERNGLGIAGGGGDLEAETIDTHELVYMLQREQWRFEAVLFHSKWQDTIQLVNQVYQNSDTSKAKGLELITEGSFDAWFWRSSLSYTESENTTQDLQFGIFPRWIVNGDIGYRFADAGLALTWSNRIHYNTDESTETTVGNSPEPLPHYWQSDLQLAKDFNPQTRVAVTVLNLFDRDNYLPSVWHTENGLETDPLTLRVSLRHRF